MDAPNEIFDQLPPLHRLLRKLSRPFDKDNFIIHSAELEISAAELEAIVRQRLRP